MKPIKWRLITVLFLTLWAIYSVTPTIYYFSLPSEVRNDKEAFEKSLPALFSNSKHVKLGLDLQGGMQLILGVDIKEAVHNRLSQISVDVSRWAEEKGLPIEKIFFEKDRGINITLKPDSDSGVFNETLVKEFPLLTKKDRQENVLFYGFKDGELKRIETAALEQAEQVIRNRVDLFGVSEPSIFKRTDGSISVQLPGFSDPTEAKNLLGRTAQLRFSIVDDEFKGFQPLVDKLPKDVKLTDNGGQVAFESENKDVLESFLAPHVPKDHLLLFERKQLGNGVPVRYLWTSCVVHAAVLLTGSDIADATMAQSNTPDRKPLVSLSMTPNGGKMFAKVTGENIGKRLAIILDNIVESAPQISQKIAGGQASINLGGGRSHQQIVDEGTKLAMVLKSGAVPATIKVLEERQVGASLGPELANQGIKGSLLGFLLVLVFMIFYYRRPGAIACFALSLNALFLLAVMANFGFALTLPGIAAFILTLGMAVDANVLINERIRQELREGRSAKKAIQQGFDRVFWTIIDSHVTTLIAALVLLETSPSGPIRGFSVTIMIGLLVSLYTSLTCTRLCFDIVANWIDEQKLRVWLGVKNSEPVKIGTYDFLKTGRVLTAIAVVLSVVTLLATGIKGLNWGVDFSGGTSMQLSFGKDVEPDQLRTIATKMNVPGISVQALDGGKRQYLLRYEEIKEDATIADANASKTLIAFKGALLDGLVAFEPKIEQVEFVGPQVGKELRNQGMVSVLYAILAVLLYVAFRFDMRFAPGAIVKMFIDIIMLLGVYVFFGLSFDLVSVAAFLTVVGYSLNDTIVIYDRIRENLSGHAKRTLRDNINISLNETLSRTINTSLTTGISLMGILVFGIGQIWYFAMAMTFGIVVATLSSQFIATSFLLWLEDWRSKKQNLPNNKVKIA